MTTRVVYHGSCWDGFGAAMVIKDEWDEYGPIPAIEIETKDKSIELIPGHYGMPIPESISNDDNVYVVDFSFPPEKMEQLRNRDGLTVWIDHHASAIEAMDAYKMAPTGRPWVHFVRITDNAHSGVMLAWIAVHGAESEPPWIVSYIEDRDLWTKALPDNEAVITWVRSHDMTVGNWEKFKSTPLEIAVDAGNHMLEYHNRMVKNAAANAFVANIVGNHMPLVSCSYDIGSDVCDYLITNTPYHVAAYVLINKSGRIQYGLRSDETVDVSTIAGVFGGGGHRQAAGFTNEIFVHEFVKCLDS